MGCQEWDSNPRSHREPELKSGALDRSAILTSYENIAILSI